MLPHSTANGCQLVYLFICLQRSTTFGLLSVQITLSIIGLIIPTYLPVHLLLTVFYINLVYYFNFNDLAATALGFRTCANSANVTETCFSMDPSRKYAPRTNIFFMSNSISYADSCDIYLVICSVSSVVQC